MKKKVIILLTVLALSLSSLGVYADNDFKSSKDMNRKSDSSALGTRSDDYIEDGEGELVSSTITRYHLEKDGKLVKIDDEPNIINKRFVMLGKAMKSTDFTVKVRTYRMKPKFKSGRKNPYYHKGEDCFKFVAVGRWYVDPFFEFTDCFTLAWTDKFVLDKSFGYVQRGSKKDRSIMAVSDSVGKESVSYDVDLQLGQDDNEIIIGAYVRKPNSKGLAYVKAKYGHVVMGAKKVSVSVGVDKKGPKIGMTVGLGSAVETAEGSTNFKY